jgi:ketosteroid isomerase-like protein
MSRENEENVEVIRRAFEATLREDWEAVLAEFHPDLEIWDHDIPDADVYRGHDGFFAWLARWGESWESWHLEDIEILPASEGRAIALFRILATGRGSGIELTRRDAITYYLRDGKVSRQDARWAVRTAPSAPPA